MVTKCRTGLEPKQVANWAGSYADSCGIPLHRRYKWRTTDEISSATYGHCSKASCSTRCKEFPTAIGRQKHLTFRVSESVICGHCKANNREVQKGMSIPLPDEILSGKALGKSQPRLFHDSLLVLRFNEVDNPISSSRFMTILNAADLRKANEMRPGARQAVKTFSPTDGYIDRVLMRKILSKKTL